MSAIPVLAEDWYWGLGGGILDVDHSDSELPHMESSTLNGFVGYNINDYLGLELQIEHIQTSTDTDDKGFRSEFGGSSVSPSLIVRYPLDRETLFEAYARIGGAYLDYSLATPAEGGQFVEGTSFQQALGGGFRTKHFFVEYVNYGKREGLFLEQLRAGFRFEF